MWQVMLEYPQIHTDMTFENVTTLPLEQRAGVELTPTESKYDEEITD